MKKEKNYKKQIKELTEQIKANSKDAHFAAKLVRELLSAKGQSMIEPTLVSIAKKDVIKEKEGDTFRMLLTDDKAVYQVKGGYTIIGDMNPSLDGSKSSFYGMIEQLIDGIDKESSSEEQKELFNVTESAAIYIMNAPMFAFTDEKFTFELATKIVKYLNDMSEELISQPLQDETPVKNARFKDAILGMENLKDEISKEK